MTSNRLALPLIPGVASPPDLEPRYCETSPIVARKLSRAMNGRPVVVRTDLAIGPGEIVAITGANGAGKTTLLRCLAGRLRPTEGEVLWFGRAPCPALHPLIGFASHEGHLYSELTASENLLFAARMHALPQPQQRVEKLLEKIGLVRHAGQPAGRLSQGQWQRLSLARALVHDPPIVILDEPFAGLDAEGQAWLEHWLKDLRTRQRAIVFSTHDHQQCRSLANRTLELGGKCLQSRSQFSDFPLARSA